MPTNTKESYLEPFVVTGELDMRGVVVPEYEAVEGEAEDLDTNDMEDSDDGTD